MSKLEELWRLLESKPRLAGVRAEWEGAAGSSFGLVEPFLQSTGRSATRYPCDEPGQDCPRRVVRCGDVITAACSDPERACESLSLTKSDIAVYSFNLLRLAQHLAVALELSGAVAAVEHLHHTVAAGDCIGSEGVSFPTYVTVQTTVEELDQVVERLVARADGPFALVLPTNKLLSPLASTALRRARCVAVALNVVARAEGGSEIVIVPEARGLLTQVGRATGPAVQTTAANFARALVCADGKRHAWQELDEAGYQALVASNANFDVFADELSRSTRVGKKRHERVPASRFKTVRAALDRRVRYDPAVEGPHEERQDGKQTFQRARALFDIKLSKREWTFFKSVPDDDGRSVYRFAPTEGYKFAFVFAPLS